MCTRIHDTTGSSRGMTLVEMLLALGVVAILWGILMPTLGSVRSAARKTKTRAQFSQWCVALEQFRAEYGYYPAIASDDLVDASRFIAALTGRSPQGIPLAGAALLGNVRRISFYSIGSEERLRAADGTLLPEFVDGFGNSQIVLLVDQDGDGLIRGSELKRKTLSAGNSRDGFTAAPPPNEPDLQPTATLSTRIALYSAGKGESPHDYVFSWK